MRSGKEAACFYAQCKGAKGDDASTPPGVPSVTEGDDASTPPGVPSVAEDDGAATPPGVPSVAKDDGDATPPGVAMDCVVKIFKTTTQKFSTKAE